MGERVTADPAHLRRVSARLIDETAGLRESGLRFARSAYTGADYGSLPAAEQARGEYLQLVDDMVNELDRADRVLTRLARAVRSAADSFESTEAQAVAALADPAPGPGRAGFAR